MDNESSIKIVFLHHSIGKRIWKGRTNSILYKITRKGQTKGHLRKLCREYRIKVLVDESVFPNRTPYGWHNYPFDYYNIWVKHAGNIPFMHEPTLEILTARYDLVIWKHCFPVSLIMLDNKNADLNSENKTLENYKLQYTALKIKMHTFPGTKFLLWTSPVVLEHQTNREQALRVLSFHDWLVNTWDEKNDNIYLWDFYALETDGGLTLKTEYAENVGDSHPNQKFSKLAAEYFANRIFWVITNQADTKNLTGIIK